MTTDQLLATEWTLRPGHTCPAIDPAKNAVKRIRKHRNRRDLSAALTELEACEAACVAHPKAAFAVSW